MPDPRIAAYVAEVSVPGIPWISTSHHTLARLWYEHGKAVVDDLLNKHWAALRAYDGELNALRNSLGQRAVERV